MPAKQRKKHKYSVHIEWVHIVTGSRVPGWYGIDAPSKQDGLFQLGYSFAGYGEPGWVPRVVSIAPLAVDVREWLARDCEFPRMLAIGEEQTA